MGGTDWGVFTIIFRFVKEFRAGFKKSSLPDRVILVWRYESESGLPASAEREAMDRLEDLLSPVVEKKGEPPRVLRRLQHLRRWSPVFPPNENAANVIAWLQNNDA